MWKNRALKNLIEVKQIFDMYNIRFWLDFGTLLGAIREGKLVDHMQDIDLGMLDEDWEKFVHSLQEFNRSGFKSIVKKFKFNDVIFKTAKLYRFGVYVDLSIYKILGNYAIDLHDRWGDMKLKFVRFLYYALPLPKFIRKNVRNANNPITKLIKHHLDVLPQKSKMPNSYAVRWLLGWKSYYYNKVPKHYFERFDRIKFYGMEFVVPSPVEDYLRYQYGKGWKVPQKHWHAMDDGSFYPLITENCIEIE
jgi:phosphorylcholine metabolism protein LicD